ncbi:MAG: hypothetical protein ACI965_001494, partial [Paraglaciecola sp.]
AADREVICCTCVCVLKVLALNKPNIYLAWQWFASEITK